jgi:hypothetical protein
MKGLNKVGWIKGPMQSVAYCPICPSSRPFVVIVTKQKRLAAGSALAAAAKAKSEVFAHMKKMHP